MIKRKVKVDGNRLTGTIKDMMEFPVATYCVVYVKIISCSPRFVCTKKKGQKPLILRKNIGLIKISQIDVGGCVVVWLG